jgi:uncharacterized protein YeaO (DUF488 family)
MIKVKHVFDAVEPDDGQRLWVEPVGLTRDLTEWCEVRHALPHVGPPTTLWQWFSCHPQGYEYFRAKYHEWLNVSPYKHALQKLACAAMKENVTLLHQGDSAAENTAVALSEFLSELEAYCPRDLDEKK